MFISLTSSLYRKWNTQTWAELCFINYFLHGSLNITYCTSWRCYPNTMFDRVCHTACVKREGGGGEPVVIWEGNKITNTNNAKHLLYIHLIRPLKCFFFLMGGLFFVLIQQEHSLYMLMSLLFFFQILTKNATFFWIECGCIRDHLSLCAECVVFVCLQNPLNDRSESHSTAVLCSSSLSLES